MKTGYNPELEMKLVCKDEFNALFSFRFRRNKGDQIVGFRSECRKNTKTGI